jgi:hypothetical protein
MRVDTEPNGTGYSQSLVLIPSATDEFPHIAVVNHTTLFSSRSIATTSLRANTIHPKAETLDVDEQLINVPFSTRESEAHRS